MVQEFCFCVRCDIFRVCFTHGPLPPLPSLQSSLIWKLVAKTLVASPLSFVPMSPPRQLKTSVLSALARRDLGTKAVVSTESSVSASSPMCGEGLFVRL